jgi:hypothetical protein
MLGRVQRSEIAPPHVGPWPRRTEPGTYMVREFANGAETELLPVELIARFRDALEHGNTQGDK